MKCPKCQDEIEVMADQWGNKRCPNCKELIEAAPRKPIEKSCQAPDDIANESPAATQSRKPSSTQTSERHTSSTHFYDRSRQTLNTDLLLSIWLKPRQTIAQILNTDPEKHVLLLAALSGFAGSSLGGAVCRKFHGFYWSGQRRFHFFGNFR